MTGRVFVLALRSARHVRLVVEHYYNPTDQEACNTDPANFNPMQQHGSGHLGLRWALLD